MASTNFYGKLILNRNTQQNELLVHLSFPNINPEKKKLCLCAKK